MGKFKAHHSPQQNGGLRSRNKSKKAIIVAFSKQIFECYA